MNIGELISRLLDLPQDREVYIQSYDGFCTKADGAIVYDFGPYEKAIVITSDNASEDNVYR